MFFLKKIRIILFFFVVTILSGCSYSNESYQVKINNIFNKNIHYIVIQSHLPQLGSIKIKNQGRFFLFKEWLLRAKRPGSIASYPDTLDRLIIVFTDDSEIVIKVSSPVLGYTGINIDGKYLLADAFPDIEEISEWRNRYRNLEKSVYPTQ